MDDLKARVCAAMEARPDPLYASADAVAARSELEFFEIETVQRFSAVLNELGIKHETGLALTGVRAGALAISARVEVTTLPGYLLIPHNPTLLDLFKANAARPLASPQRQC
jgi:hypothetical protein